MRRFFKRISALLLLVFTWGILLSSGVLAGTPQGLDEAVKAANEELKRNYYVMQSKGRSLNEGLWKDRQSLVYGSPHGDFDKEKGRYRYLGYTRDGDEFTNYQFPHDDFNENKMLDDRKWIKEPWEEGLSKRINFSNNPTWRPNMVEGLKRTYGQYFRGDFKEWEKYMHILQPPTMYAWGMGRMWHKDDKGKVWYITVPIAPTSILPPPPQPTPPTPTPQQPSTPAPPEEAGNNNLKIYITGNSGDPWPGNTVTVNAQAINASEQLLYTDVVWKLNGKVIKTVNNFDIVKTASNSVTFTMPSGDAKIEVLINPNKNRPTNETTWADNAGGKTLKPLTLSPPSGKDITVKINAPAEVLGYTSTGAANLWKYSVTVTYNWKRPKGYTGPPPKQTVTLTSTATGTVATWDDARKINKDFKNKTEKYSKTFTISGGESLPIPNIPGPGTFLFNQDEYVVINAKLSTGASASAKVLVKGMPLDLNHLIIQ